MGIKLERIKKKIKQKDLAAAVGITQQYLAELENGHANNPTKKVMDRIAEELGVTVQQLFYEEV